jgi:predicted glutamine amidotransferase
MCRLFGLRAQNPTDVHRALAGEKNSLKTQSNEHKDGWGIAIHDNGGWAVSHGLQPAHADPGFAEVCSKAVAPAIVAHIRLASIGGVHHRNAHPFVHGPWVFAHNGTVHRFVEHQGQIESLIDPELRASIKGETDSERRASMKGETDSERCFMLLLTQLREIAQPRAADVARAMARTMRTLSEIADRADLAPKDRTSMNFLLTDGRLMVCSRRGRTLFYSARPLESERIEHLAIASEALTDEPWHEVPEDGIIGVDADFTFHQWSVAEL